MILKIVMLLVVSQATFAQESINNLITVSAVTDGSSVCNTIESDADGNQRTRKSNGCYTYILTYQRNLGDNIFLNVGLGAAGAKQFGIGFGW